MLLLLGGYLFNGGRDYSIIVGLVRLRRLNVNLSGDLHLERNSSVQFARHSAI